LDAQTRRRKLRPFGRYSRYSGKKCDSRMHVSYYNTVFWYDIVTMRKKVLWILLVLVLGVALRLRNFWELPIDAHPMRQTDTECVAYFLAKGESSFFLPKACLIRPVTNKEGLFFLEAPFYEGLLALSYKVGNFSILGPRVVNLFLYVVATVSLIVFVEKLLGWKLAIVSGLLFSLTPSSIFFLGHAIHPDVLAVAAMMLGLAILVKIKSFGTDVPPSPSQGTINIVMLIIGGVLLGVAVATRPFALIVLPVYFWILWKSKSKWWNYGLILILGVGFYGLWKWWSIRIGLNADWENWVLEGREKLFDLGYLKNFLYKNVVGEIIGKAIFALFLLGSIVAVFKKEKRLIPIVGWMAIIPVYWLMVPNGNMTHQYYGDVYIVPIVIVAALGLGFVLEKSRLLALILVGLVIFNGYRTSDYLFSDKVYPEKIVYAKEIEENIPEGSKVIYMVKSDSVPLSLAHRQGWMLGEWPTDVSPTIWAFMEMRHMGFDYIVEPKGSMDMKREDVVVIEENYPLWKETENLRILKKD